MRFSFAVLSSLYLNVVSVLYMAGFLSREKNEKFACEKFLAINARKPSRCLRRFWVYFVRFLMNLEVLFFTRNSKFFSLFREKSKVQRIAKYIIGIRNMSLVSLSILTRLGKPRAISITLCYTDTRQTQLHYTQF